MNAKKTVLVAAAAATVGLTGIGGLGVASAATDSSADPKSSLIDKLVSKFDLNKSEVEQVFEEQRTEKEAEMKQNIEDRLDEAVSEGKLTEAQKEAILDKLAELREEREADREKVKDMTHEERHEHMQQKHEALKEWAEDNDIPEEYLPGAVVKRHIGGGMGKPVLIDGFDAPANEQ
jgi:hypothetical protein